MTVTLIHRTRQKLKTMLLFHGLSSDTHSYIRYTSIERYANEYQLAIIMPNADHSFIRIWLSDTVIMITF